MNEISPTMFADRQTPFGGERDDSVAMFNMILGHVVAQVVRCAGLFSLADHLADGPAAAKTIARAEGLDETATVRLMRACTAFGLMTYDKETGFFGTPLLAMLRRDDPRRMRAGAIALTGHGHWAPWGQLSEAIRTGEPRAEATLGSGIFDYFASPAGAAEAEAFSHFLAGISGAVSEEAARFIDTRRISLAVDVGGSNGLLVHALMQANPSLRGMVLDLPHVATEAAKAAEALGLSDRFSFVGSDFRNAVPPADLYLIKRVLHVWPDATCDSILQNCRRALRPGGQVIVLELLADDIEPGPLVAQLDLTMMAICGSKERTLDEYKRLLAAAGLRFVRATATETPLFLICRRVIQRPRRLGWPLGKSAHRTAVPRVRQRPVCSPMPEPARFRRNLDAAVQKAGQLPLAVDPRTEPGRLVSVHRRGQPQRDPETPLTGSAGRT